MAEGTQSPSSQSKEQYWGGHIDAWRNVTVRLTASSLVHVSVP